jgi:hypothetical protein
MPSTARRFSLKCLIHIFAVAALSLCCLAGCGKFRNVHPGDSEYPQLNPHPVRGVMLTIVSPPALHLEFVARYNAEVHAPECTYYRAIELTDLYYVEEPMDLTREGDVLKGRLFLDKYEAGRCGYQFVAAYYRPHPYNDQESSNELLRVGPRDTFDRMDVYCKVLQQVPDCGSLKGWEMVGGVSKGDYASLEAGGYTRSPPAHIDGGPQALFIQVHDLGAPDGGRSIIKP